MERLRHDRGGVAGEEVVRDPGPVEFIGCVDGATTVNVVRDICKD